MDGFAAGANPWFTKFNARIVDDRWIAPVAHAFGLHALVERNVPTDRAAPEVCILDSVSIDDADVFASYTARFLDEDGFYHALVEARIPFGYVCDGASRSSASAACGSSSCPTPMPSPPT